MAALCVAGGTGQVGRQVVRQALISGHSVSVFSRHLPAVGSAQHIDGARYFIADATTGTGLAEALAGADVVIDCLEGRAGRALKDYPLAGARLVAAAETAGVRRAVVLSIINCDQSHLRFHRSKAAKDRLYAGSGLETVVVRATQFHSLLAGLFAAGSRLRLVPVIRDASFQTISPSDVAAALLEEALENPSDERHRMRTVGGPEVGTMRDLAESWRRMTDAKGWIVELPLPGSMGKYLRAGMNLIPEQRFGRETFEGWLAKRRDSL